MRAPETIYIAASMRTLLSLWNDCGIISFNEFFICLIFVIRGIENVKGIAVLITNKKNAHPMIYAYMVNLVS